MDHSQPVIGLAGSPILLLGMSLATALPPTVLLSPPGAVRPVVRSDHHTSLDLTKLTAALDRPTAELWRGQIHLGEIDERLRGLEMRLQIVRVVDGSGALVHLGTVSPAPATAGVPATRPIDLWRLACEAHAQSGATYGCQAGIGETAFLAVYGGVTAQVAWLASGRLATASVTSLVWEQDWTVVAARSVAVLLDHELRRRPIV
jgi:hypothetical protein